MVHSLISSNSLILNQSYSGCQSAVCIDPTYWRAWLDRCSLSFFLSFFFWGGGDWHAMSHFLLLSINSPQILYRKYLTKEKRVSKPPSSATPCAVSHALICWNPAKVKDLLHTPLLYNIWYFLSFRSLCFPSLQSVMLSLSEEIAFWFTPSFLWQLLHLKSERSPQYIAEVVESHLLGFIQRSRPLAPTAHFGAIIHHIQTTSPK